MVNSNELSRNLFRLISPSINEMTETATTDTTVVAQDESLLAKIASLSLEPGSDPVLVPFTAKDVELWRDFEEYRGHRKGWDEWREEEWKKNHPLHIHELFSTGFPVLETPRLRLRLLRPSDAEDIFKVLSNPVAVKYYGQQPHKDIAHTQKQYIDLMIGRHRVRDSASFVITLKERDDDKYIGHVNALSFDRMFKFSEISYILNPEYWGKGYGTEAVGKVVAFLVEEMKIHKVRAGFFAKNVASKRVLEKVGFKQEGYLRDNVLIDGEFEDEYVMAFIASS